MKDISISGKKGDIETIIKKDAEFHQVLFSATRNERLAQMINTLKEHIDRFRIESFNNPVRINSVLKEHKKIVEAIKQGDSNNAERLAKEHIYEVEYNVMNMLRNKMDFEGEPL